MSVKDSTCPTCGQKVLAVATRCPHCGAAFEAQFYQHPAIGTRSRRIPVGMIAAALVVTVVVANAARRYLVTGRPARPASPAVAAPRHEPPTLPPVDAAPAAGSGQTAEPRPSPETPDTSPPPGPTAAVTVSPGDGVDTATGIRRRATGWTNVRAGRSPNAPVLRVLRPGEAVLVDSLRLGWYRLVSAEGAAGYVDAHLLDSVPRPAP